MKWEVINIPDSPKCIFCHTSDKQMARFTDWCNQYAYICSACARYVKDAIDKWEGLKDVNYIEQTGIYKSDIDKVIEENKDKALFPEVNPLCRCGQTGFHPLTDECRQK
jgi:hypothetical protein